MRTRTSCSFARWFTLLGCCLAAAFSCFANCESASGHYVDLALRDSPTSIQTLAKEIRDKSDDEIEAIVTKQFGVGRDVGSGVRILQWDVENGVLTLGRGLTVFRPTGGKVLWLTATSSKALQTVTNDRFEMTTLPSPQMKYWLGDLELKTGSTYNFIDSREWESLQHRGKQKRNFFLKHQTGRFAIQFAPGCSPDTVLERLPDGTLLCNLTFFPADGSPEDTYDIVAYPSERRLKFSRNKASLQFLMDKGW
jgi:hypothetical protein